jgi:Flp pilus assembly protein TadB
MRMDRIDRTGILERQLRVERKMDEYRKAKRYAIDSADLTQNPAAGLREISRARLALLWIAVVAVIIAAAVIGGIDITVRTSGLMLALWWLPPMIMLFVWRSRSDPHTAESRKEGRA